jgi:hypothetical protein
MGRGVHPLYKTIHSDILLACKIIIVRGGRKGVYEQYDLRHQTAQIVILEFCVHTMISMAWM